MMVSMEVYLRRGRRRLLRWEQLPGMRKARQVLCWSGAGFVLSGAGLGAAAQPLIMGLCCAAEGWRSIAAGAGAMLGYRFFWQEAGLQGLVWSLLACVLGILPGKKQLTEEYPFLFPALASFLTAAAGLVFQLTWLEDVTLGTYALRAAAAALAVLLFSRRRDALLRWCCGGLAALSLSRVAPVPWLNFGHVVCGYLIGGGPFPGAVLAGLGVDLAGAHSLPMTAVVCCACLLRRMYPNNLWLRCGFPGIACLGIQFARGQWDLSPLPGLMLGTIAGEWLAPTDRRVIPQGRVGGAQVRLELASRVFSEIQQMLLQTATPPVDEQALLEKVRLHACSACSARGGCLEQQRLTVYHLRQPLEFTCRKSGRIRGELRRGREQLALLRRDRQTRQEYHSALVQQYRFLGEYVQTLADTLGNREAAAFPKYRIRVSARSRKKEYANGDCCTAFPGTGYRYYVVLCDGMGTGLGAAREGETALELLRQMLACGFPAEHALRSINSMLVLRGMGGAVTMDLAEICLDSGKTALFKWGAAPSYLLSRRRIEKIGDETLPPGLWVNRETERVRRFCLYRGDTLILLSDGVDPGPAWNRILPEMDTGEMARTILTSAAGEADDDATAVVVQLVPSKMQDSTA